MGTGDSVGLGGAEAEKGLDEDLDVEAEAPVALVAEVGVDATGHGLEVAGFTAPALHLGEAGDAGLEGVALHVAGDEAAVLLVVVDGVGARTDEAHLTAEDVEELGQFIEAPAAQDATEGCDAGIIAGGLAQAGLVTGLEYAHGAELEDAKAAAIEAVAILGEEDGPRAGEGHSCGDHGQDGSDEQNAETGEQQVHSPFGLAVDEGAFATPEVDAVDVPDAIGGEVHGAAGPGGGVDHRQAGVTEELQQLVHGEVVAGHVAEDDGIHLLFIQPAAHLHESATAAGQGGGLVVGSHGNGAEPGHEPQAHPGSGEELALEIHCVVGGTPVEEGASVAAPGAMPAKQATQTHMVDKQRDPGDEGPEAAVEAGEGGAGAGDEDHQQEGGQYQEPGAGDAPGDGEQAAAAVTAVQTCIGKNNGGEGQHPNPGGKQKRIVVRVGIEKLEKCCWSKKVQETLKP